MSHAVEVATDLFACRLTAPVTETPPPLFRGSADCLRSTQRSDQRGRGWPRLRTYLSSVSWVVRTVWLYGAAGSGWSRPGTWPQNQALSQSPRSWLQFDQRRSSRHPEPFPATGARSCLYGIPVLNMTDSRNLGTQGAGKAKESPMKGKTDELIMRGSQ